LNRPGSAKLGCLRLANCTDTCKYVLHNRRKKDSQISSVFFEQWIFKVGNKELFETMQIFIHVLVCLYQIQMKWGFAIKELPSPHLDKLS